MTGEHEPPLSQFELRVVRGMIDQYRYELERNRRWRGLLSDGRMLTVAAVAAGSFILQIVSLWVHR